ncbi:MAG: hypothetical protein R3B83_02655 [Nitrospirales bacterium]|nr:hypothetical protein [Nitrospirales bacterium]
MGRLLVQAHPLTNDLIFLAVVGGHPYVKILRGQQGYHGFVHNGQSLRYSPLTIQREPLGIRFHRRINHAASNISPFLRTSTQPWPRCPWESTPSLSQR